MRQLKYHESRLLKKVDLLNWKTDNRAAESKVIQRYHLTNREDYHSYNKLCGLITRLSHLLIKLDPSDPLRLKLTEDLLEKLYNVGVIVNKRSLGECEKVAVSAFARRRLAIVLVRLKFAENVKDAIRLISHGHIRVGPHIVTDPATLITRKFEDYIQWTDTSKIKRTIMKYNDRLDDYDLLG
eukprot:comp5071_c0_seq1/m.4170 comp5071_c0_seq1/g.4170  ORF comp5071_c0_seq1/g.4170 comp5071_c0_seq1/m.4170 type:complete len:183 (+) comp5071_c0_seq1:12-560(+)